MDKAELSSKLAFVNWLSIKGAAAVNVEMKKTFPQSASRLDIPRVVGVRYTRGKTAMNKKKIYKWLYKKAADAIGEEELQSLKNDLVNPVKIAANVDTA